MPKLFDEDGKEVEVMSDEDIAALKEKADEATKKAEELEETLKGKEEELNKRSDKEFNFKAFRDSEEEKKKEMLNDFTEKEQTLIKEISGMKKQQDESDERYFSQAKTHALKNLAGDDEELKTKLEDAVKESIAFLGRPKDADDVISRYERAYSVVMGSAKNVNPLNRFAPVTGIQTEQRTDGSFADSPAGKATIEEKFGKEIEHAKRNNPDFTI